MDGPESDDGTRRRRRRYARRAAFHCLLWSLVAVVLVPLVWPLMRALNDVTIEEFLDRGFLWWLRGAEFEVVVGVLAFSPLRRILANSFLVATVSAVVSAGLATAAAYALHRFRFAGRRPVAGALLAFLTVPQAVVAIPLFTSVRSLGLHDTYVGLIAAYVAYTLPFAVWLLYPLFSRIPTQYEQAALVDGCTRPGAFLRVFLPTAKPAFAAAVTLAWILAYNDYFYAVMLIDDPAKYTLPIGLRQGAGPPGLVAVVATLPVLAVFAVLWRFFLSDESLRYAG